MRPARKNRKIEENKSGPAGKRGESGYRESTEESNRGGRPGQWGGGDGRGRKKRKRHRGTSRRIIRVAACARTRSILSAPFLSRARQYPFETLPFIPLSLSFFFFSFSLPSLLFLLLLRFFLARGHPGDRMKLSFAFRRRFSSSSLPPP